MSQQAKAAKAVASLWPGFRAEERAALILQTSVRLFLQRNAEYWEAVEVALYMQAWWRGRKSRRQYKEESQRLEFFRYTQRRVGCAIRIQRWWQVCLTADEHGKARAGQVPYL